MKKSQFLSTFYNAITNMRQYQNREDLSQIVEDEAYTRGIFPEYETRDAVAVNPVVHAILFFLNEKTRNLEAWELQLWGNAEVEKAWEYFEVQTNKRGEEILAELRKNYG